MLWMFLIFCSDISDNIQVMAFKQRMTVEIHSIHICIHMLVLMTLTVTLKTFENLVLLGVYFLYPSFPISVKETHMSESL